MSRLAKYFILGLAMVFVTGLSAYSQKVEQVDGVRVVHNSKKGIWGDQPKVGIEPVRTIGEIETNDENVAFNLPSDVALDKDGNIYILDSGNHRVQKFSADGKYLATFGRKGQGPGEFVYPESIDIDDAGYIYVSDPRNQRIQVLTPEGKEARTIKMIDEQPGVIRLAGPGRMVMAPGSLMMMFSAGEEDAKELPKLMTILDDRGAVQHKFGEQRDYKDFLLNKAGNGIQSTLDGQGNVYLAFSRQNRIEKYSSDGSLLWRADRELDYNTEPKDRGKMERRGGGTSIRMPELNTCSVGIAADSQGRLWVASLQRQLKEEEKAGMKVQMSMSGGERNISMKADGNIELRDTDAYRLEVYDPDGVLLGIIPLDRFVDDIRIEQDRLFFIDRMRGAQIREYRIVEK
ncbi:MAG: NHL repeat-containing protein [Candidatus Aminicenantes bacterium]|nr:NHL repeat-containing protein [Candidatus Aminicenantes bacterium]